MKTLIILLMPLLILLSFIASNHFFIAADYYTSAIFTLTALGAVTVWIAAMSSKKLALR